MPTDNFLLFQIAEERNMTVGFLLSGKYIPMTSMEFEIYKVYQTAKARMRWQERNNKDS